MHDWLEHQEKLARVAKAQLFFVGGAPRSGTTWLQHLLNSHPEICCGSESLFMKHLAAPLDKMMAERRDVLAEKYKTVFRDFSNLPLPEPDQTDHLVGTAILLALEQQSRGRDYRAIGEKTPENVFFFSRLKGIFPHAKLIVIARDPRDVLSSAWHYFQKAQHGKDEQAAKIAFIRLALPSLQQGARVTLELAERYKSDCHVITYEQLHATPEVVAAGLFHFLKVADGTEIVAECIAKTSFTSFSGGRPAGVARDDSFFRKGIVGDWRSTFSPEMSDLILADLGWLFPHFGWQK